MIIPGIDDNYIISLFGKSRAYELAIFRDAAKAFNIERDAYKSRIRYLELELAKELVSKGMSIHDISQKLSISESVVRCVCEEDKDDQD